MERMVEALRRLVYWGKEERNLEYKQSMNWALPETKAKLAKSILAMANLRDGGTIILGLKREADDSYTPEGMSNEDFDSFSQDHLSAHISEFADPYVEATLTKNTIEGRRYCIIQVAEFDEIPVICKRNGDKLRRGATYIRSRRMNETVEVPSQIEMREILDLATEKRVRAFYSQARRMNVEASKPGNDESANRFLQQRKTVGETKVQAHIWQARHWHTMIRPTEFMEARFRDLLHCKEFVSLNAVRHGKSSDYPYINLQFIQDYVGDDWISSEVELGNGWDRLLERWVLFQSAQFTHYRALPENPLIGGKLHFFQVVRLVGQVFEFSARMAHEGVLSPEVEITLELCRVNGLGLFVPNDPSEYWSREGTIAITKYVAPKDLQASSAELALDAAIAIYERFGWTDVPRSVLAQEHLSIL